jgi:hypothetical protein
MMQSIEAIVNKEGEIRLLEPIQIQENRRAIVTILDEAPMGHHERKDAPPKPKGMGRYHSGRSDVSQNAKTLVRNLIRKSK